MKLKTFALEYTVNTGNYSNVKLRGEWSVDANDKIEDVAVEARRQLVNAYIAQLQNKQETNQNQTTTSIASRL